MNLASNKFIDVKKYFYEKLENHYTLSEIKIFFEILASHFLNLSKTDILIGDTPDLSESEILQFVYASKDLRNKKPIQYITGNSEFYGLTFKVNHHTLIPRPETEELVDLVLKSKANKNSILDIGTGTGCIPISLKHHLPNSLVEGVDISNEALALAKENSLLNRADVNFYTLDILTREPKNDYDIIISNPPYVLESDKAEMQEEVLQYEPHLALFVPNHSPLLFYDRIAEVAKNKLKKNGHLFFEIHQNFGQETLDMLSEKGYKNLQLIKDINENDRIIVAEW